MKDKIALLCLNNEFRKAEAVVPKSSINAPKHVSPAKSAFSFNQ
jgi:hypothetical protein